MKYLLILIHILLIVFLVGCSDKGVYVGELKEVSCYIWYKCKEPNGHGTKTWKNGKKYVGEFKDGMFYGQGTLTDNLGTYEGEFRDGKHHGQGTLTWTDGSSYIGQWKEGKHHGQVTITFSGGSKWVGEFRNYELWNVQEIDSNGNITKTWINGVQQQ